SSAIAAICSASAPWRPTRQRPMPFRRRRAPPARTARPRPEREAIVAAGDHPAASARLKTWPQQVTGLLLWPPPGEFDVGRNGLPPNLAADPGVGVAPASRFAGAGRGAPHGAVARRYR